MRESATKTPLLPGMTVTNGIYPGLLAAQSFACSPAFLSQSPATTRTGRLAFALRMC
jgi:hypothetical protein